MLSDLLPVVQGCLRLPRPCPSCGDASNVRECVALIGLLLSVCGFTPCEELQLLLGAA